jgi:hypothetical protein
MKLFMRTVLAGGVAMLALSLATAGVAAAATTPEFKPVPTKHKFKGTGGTWTASSRGEEFTCPKGTVAGEISGGRNLGSIVVTFTGCTSDSSEGRGCPVNTVGAKSGEVVSKALTSELGTVATKEAPSGVGLLLKPEGTSEKWWAMVENKCTSESGWYGDLTVEVAVIGKKQTTNKLVITPGLEQIKLDSGISKATELVEFAAPVKWKNTFEVTFEEPVEVT